nr:hypothetical protein [Tanacetum cinerariifolium]
MVITVSFLGIKPRNPQHVMKSYETCGSIVHTTTDHNDIECFRRGSPSGTWIVDAQGIWLVSRVTCTDMWNSQDLRWCLEMTLHAQLKYKVNAAKEVTTAEENILSVNTANEVSTASTQVNATFYTNIDNLSDVVICSFFASQPNSPQLVHEELEQIHQDDIMAMLTIRARRDCRAQRNQDNKHKESSRRSVPMETTNSIALVSCDGLSGYEWSD